MPPKKAARAHCRRAALFLRRTGSGRAAGEAATFRRLMKNTFSRTLALGWRNLWRDVRAGELRLLMLAYSDRKSVV